MKNSLAKHKICLVVGDPIDHSLSPQMHSSGFKALGIDDRFVFLAAKVSIERVAYLVTSIKTLGILGVSCTIPHKTAVIDYLDEIDPVAKKIGAVNTLVNKEGQVKGFNTDWLGIVKPLEQLIEIKNKKVALIGAGGAARAVSYAINIKKGKLMIFNRSLEKALALAKEFNGQAFSLDQIAKVEEADVIINATSLGMKPEQNKTPVPKECLHKGQIVFDIIYNPMETRLLREAKSKGAKIIYGLEMLLEQGVAQFQLYTGYSAPVEVMRQTLIKCLEGNT